jgi:hypothetical protein
MFVIKRNIHVTMFDNQFSSAGKVMRRIRLSEVNGAVETDQDECYQKI